MSQLNPGRLAAGRVLMAIQRGGHAEDLLAELAPDSGPDRRLAWHIVLGVLRRQGTLDSVLQSVAGRPLAKLDPPVLIAARIGLFELALARTPTRAAVDQAVELCRSCGCQRATGFVNAVLRRAAGRPLPNDPWLDLPPWLAKRWRGEFASWVPKLAQAPPLAGVWRDPSRPVDLLPTAPATAAGQLVPGAFTLTDFRGPVGDLPGFADGAWWVMDPAAAAVADLVQPRPGLRVLDACAAPGGKTLRLAAAGCELLSVDLDPDRLALVDEASQRTGLPVTTQQHDWLTGALPTDQRFDAVLVDAPCTGLGTLRRHPEIRWRRRPTDPAAMALRQRRILRAASQHVAPGGRLIYAVCSPMPEEGIDVIDGLAGFEFITRWSSVPPQADEDAFQAFVLVHTDAPLSQ